jgi:tRNA (mo5U34)-methyltransferase
MSLRARVAALRGFHQIDLGDGIVTPGMSEINQLKAQADIYFRDDITGLSLLVIGCWDGFNALEAVRRGASRVLATDHWVWAHHDWASRQTVELVREIAAPSMGIVDIDLADLTPERVGTYDVVLFCGVLYHLRNPLPGLGRVRRPDEVLATFRTRPDRFWGR